MKYILSVLVSIFCINANAQMFTYKVNEATHTYNKNNVLTAKYEDGRIDISVDVSGNYASGTWNDIELICIGNRIGNYILGAAADEKISNNNGSELGTGKILLNYCDAKNENHTKNTFMADEDNTTGYIKITTIENKKITGSFYAKIAGVGVEGQFADIEVKGL